MGLTKEEIDALLNKPTRGAARPKAPQYNPAEKYKLPPQTSSYVRFVDKEHRCASRGCGTSTHTLLKGIPYCEIHTIHQLADLLEQQVNHYPNRPPWIEQYLEGYLQMGSDNSSDSSSRNTTQTA